MFPLVDVGVVTHTLFRWSGILHNLVFALLVQSCVRMTPFMPKSARWTSCSTKQWHSECLCFKCFVTRQCSGKIMWGMIPHISQQLPHKSQTLSMLVILSASINMPRTHTIKASGNHFFSIVIKEINFYKHLIRTDHSRTICRVYWWLKSEYILYNCVTFHSWRL